MSESLSLLVARYGYAVVALLVGAEGVGIPLPGETALLAAGALAAQGHLSIGGVIIAAALGVAVGGSGGYWVGRTAGSALVVRYGVWVGITPERLVRTRQFFARHGTRAVIVGRFLPIVRILAGITAGVTDIPFWKFATYNALAGIAWSSTFGVLGYALGRNLPTFERQFGQIGLVIAGAALIGGVVLLIRWGRRKVASG